MKNLLVFIITFYAISGFSQKKNYWIGGFPGQTTKWECSRNWSLNKVPDYTSDVIIENLRSRGNYYPVLNSNVILNSLWVLDGASLGINTFATIRIVSTIAEYGLINLGHISNIEAIYIEENREYIDPNSMEITTID